MDTVELPPALCIRDMTRTKLTEASAADFQDGAAATQQKGMPRGADKVKDTGAKSLKMLRTPGKDPPRDILYYA